jgi:hypothetical protein
VRKRKRGRAPGPQRRDRARVGRRRVTLYNWSSKKKVRPQCRTFGSPVFTFARISVIRKMVKRGKIAATKWR